MERVKFLILSIILLIFILSCATSKVSVIPLSAEPQGYSYLQKIGRKVLSTMEPERIYQYGITILDSQEVNAFADGERYILFFTLGALRFFDEQEMTYIYAHEVAHITLKHWEKRLAVSTVTSVFFTVANVFIPGVGLLNYAANPLLTRAFSRSQELDADTEAIKAIQKCCGLSPFAAINALSKLLEKAKAKGYREEDRIGILDTHPSLEERIRKIKETILK